MSLLLQVARSGSFTAAAKQLGVEQSTVSRRIRALEDALGVALFERHATRSVLTPLGERFRQRAETVEAEVHALVDEVSGAEREVVGQVRLALTESIAVYAVIPRILPQLREQHPGLRVQLLTSYAAAALGQWEAELALRFFRPTTGDLVTKRLLTMRTAFVAHRRYLGQRRTDIPYVGVKIEGIPTHEEEFLRQHVGVEPSLLTSSYLSQIEAVRAGLGAAILPRSSLALDAELVELDLGLPSGPELELWLVTPRSLRHVPRIDAVWTALEKGLGFLAE